MMGVLGVVPEENDSEGDENQNRRDTTFSAIRGPSAKRMWK